MSSETITRNDLTNILNEVLTASSGMTVEDISDKITFTGAWSNYMRKAYLIGGKFVFFTLEGYASTIIAGAQYTIATIASGYRPKDNLVFTGHATDANYLPQSTVNCYVWTSGDITVRCSNGNGNYVFVSCWYALADGSAPVIVADYIVEQGTANTWNYRKWNSGIAECWKRQDSVTYNLTTNYGNGSYYTTDYWSFPNGLFTSVEYVDVHRINGGLGLISFSISSVTTSRFDYSVWNNGSSLSSQTYDLCMCAKGKWK